MTDTTTSDPANPPSDSRNVSIIALSMIAIGIGIVTGLGAIALRYLISVIHNFFFLGIFSFDYDANVPTSPAPYGALVILAPVVGGAIVLWLVRRFAPEAKGHGVPEVMNAIYYRNGYIRPQVVLIKSLASAMSIGSGASVGREGPIIQIGSGIGSVLGRMFNLRSWQVITMVAAGAGAGIAATFNTPLGAVLFAVELMLPEFSARTLLPVVLATGTATYVGRLAFGIEPAFLVAAHNRPDLFVPLSVDMLPLYVIFGLLAGLASWLFIKVLYRTEDLFDDWKINPYLKNAIGMLSLGILFYVLLLTTGQYHTESVGYASIEAVLTGQLAAPGFLLLLFVLKMIATSVSLGAGASGGVFSPSLFLGAMLGGAFGGALDLMFPHLGFHSVTFALIGMAGIVGASTGGAITSIMMLFEMTGDYTITVAAIIAVVCAVGVRRRLTEDDIYTTKLSRRGHHIPRESRSHSFSIRRIRDLMAPAVGILEKSDLGPSGVVDTDLGEERVYAVVTEGRHVVGVVRVHPEDPTKRHGPIIKPVGFAQETSFLRGAMTQMADRNHAALLVIPEKAIPRAENVIGVLTRDAIATSVLRDYRS
ncbi:chloride channel protein [Pseudodonghicola xiamenensis]|uniref:Chloride channel protein n=1 Tax=Pseudodonghicola xiamenensis TaxID=337702 RepID=A0A8J3ME42_9RHOB|nr:chloride channel protein [Pseudodonghicola xiamenensis]GHG95712.1 chloride channel protein [Pseudodonghicola xiamenensis]